MSETDRVCDSPNCGKRAQMHLTQIVDDKTFTQHLCKSCAEEKGLNAPSDQDADIVGFAEQLAQGDEEDEAAAPCASCGLSLAGFRRTGRLGCQQCYTAFEGRLRGLFGRIHGAARHTGKLYLPRDPAAADRDRRLDDLRRRLRGAVDREDFERAAKLRDQIRELEPAGTP